MARPVERLSMALLRMRITKALQEMREQCEQLNFNRAVEAEREMNARLDDLARRLRHAG